MVSRSAGQIEMMNPILLHTIVICIGALALWLLAGLILIWRGRRTAPIYNDGKEH